MSWNEIIPKLQELTKLGKFTYFPLTEKTSLKDAMKMVSQGERRESPLEYIKNVANEYKRLTGGKVKVYHKLDFWEGRNETFYVYLSVSVEELDNIPTWDLYEKARIFLWENYGIVFVTINEEYECPIIYET